MWRTGFAQLFHPWPNFRGGVDNEPQQPQQWEQPIWARPCRDRAPVRKQTTVAQTWVVGKLPKNTVLYPPKLMSAYPLMQPFYSKVYTPREASSCPPRDTAVYNRPNQTSIEKPINRKMDKSIVEYHGTDKKQPLLLHSKKESHGNKIKKKKADSKETMLCDSVFIKFKKQAT